MPFNQDKLSLLALVIRDDQPVDPAQPPLPDGLHLRWAPGQEVGFPWYGFYLFRRESRPSRSRCLSAELARLRPGTTRSLLLETALGGLRSAKPLALTDVFPPSAQVEVDLDQGAPLRFELPAGVEARRVDVQIGLRSAAPCFTRTYADFRALPLGGVPSPRREQGVVFTTDPLPVSPSVAIAAVEQWPGTPKGLQTTRRLEIALLCLGGIGPGELVDRHDDRRRQPILVSEPRRQRRSARAARTGPRAGTCRRPRRRRRSRRSRSSSWTAGISTVIAGSLDPPLRRQVSHSPRSNSLSLPARGHCASAHDG
jgi:hypothetical protein